MNRLSAFDVVSNVVPMLRRRCGRHVECTADLGCFRRSANSDERQGNTWQVAVAPDGICLDAEGAVWVADAMHARLLRVAEGGRIMEELKTDGLGAFACMLGGDDGRTLFACVAPTFHEAEASANHRASILMTKVKVPHAGLP